MAKKVKLTIKLKVVRIKRDFIDALPQLPLKPCPFCGGNSLFIDATGPRKFAIMCLDCDAAGPAKRSCKAADKAWDKRKVR